MVISKDDVAIICIYRLNLIILMRFVEASPCITYMVTIHKEDTWLKKKFHTEINSKSHIWNIFKINVVNLFWKKY